MKPSQPQAQKAAQPPQPAPGQNKAPIPVATQPAKKPDPPKYTPQHDSEDQMKGIPFSHKKEKSKYADMSKEEKMKMTVRRIEEDRLRASHQLPLLKKGEVKKKLFVTKKKVYDLSHGYAICISKIPDKEAYYFGLSNGTVLFLDLKTEKIMTAVKGENPILDILALSNDRFITVDDYSRIKIYDNYKLIKIFSSSCAFINGSYSYGKILTGNENYFYFINATNDGVVKVSLADFSFENLNLGRGKLFQIHLQDDVIYALTEDGYLVSCTMWDQNKMSPDEHEAHPNGIELAEVKIENLTNDQIGLGQKVHATDMLEKSLVVDGEEHVQLNNSSGGHDLAHSMAEGSAKDKTKSDESYDRMNRVFNIPILSKFFRTLAVSQDYIAVVAHDGQGHNIMYLYTHKLQLKAFKFLKIEENDYSFNLTKYLHKVEIVQRKEGTYIYTICHKKEYKMYVYKLVENEIELFRRYKGIHSSLITDLRSDGDAIVTCSKDKKVNMFFLDYKFDLRL